MNLDDDEEKSHSSYSPSAGAFNSCGQAQATRHTHTIRWRNLRALLDRVTKWLSGQKFG